MLLAADPSSVVLRYWKGRDGRSILTSSQLWAGVEAVYVALDIHDAAKWILKTGDL